MRLKLTLASGAEVDDVVVTVDATATVGQLAERLRASHPRQRAAVATGPSLSLRVHPGTASERTLAPTSPMGEAALRSGDVVALTHASGGGGASQLPVATVQIVSGADAGRAFSLPYGTTLVGRERSCEVRLSDSMVSKRHAKLIVTDMVEVVDDNSANGVFVNGDRVQRAVVGAGDQVQVGDTTFAIALHLSAGAIEGGGHAIEFNRGPRLDPTYPGVKLVAPEPPQRSQHTRFPIVSLVAPVMMAGMMYAITKNATSILFVALSPLMLIGGWVENRLASRKALATATAAFRSSLTDLAVQLQYAGEAERTARRREHPSASDVLAATVQLGPLLWTRRPEHERFLQLRLGLGVLPSRNEVELPATNNTLPELWRELHDVTGQFSMIDRVPVVASLRDCGGLGIAGPAAVAHPLALATVFQLAGLHSPAEVVIAAITNTATQARWEWLKWLPHAGSDHSPLACEHLTSSSPSALALISALEEVVEARAAVRRDDGAVALPAIVVVVEDEAVHERPRLATLAERGPANGVFVIWMAPSVQRIPAACRAFLEVDPNTGEGRVGFVDGGVGIGSLELEPLDHVAVTTAARRMSPVMDAGALLEDQSDLPRSVSFLTLGGLDLAENPDEVVQRWAGSNSLPPAPGSPRLRKDNSLRALVGQGAADRFYLDLRTDGPHALVGGTTGAGKSEFLQSWILGMAAAHSPARVNFLFVDYKGGAAFAECVKLPHNVGLVTDLSPHLVRRALRSLNAELRRREHLFNRKKAKDLLELERRRDPDAPPSLVIVVDEFAALVTEVPEFVDGVVNVAQRGRSLGLHLILATQRPAGVIKGNLRANTNLRVALRMADESDSDDVIGTTQAASFDPSLPGRGVAKTGPGRLSAFQSAYAGGFTSSTPPPPIIDVNELPFGVGGAWDVPEGPDTPADDASGPNDIHRVVANIAAAAERAHIAEPRKPWMPELADSFRLEDLPTQRTDRSLVFGVIDRPDDQDQTVVAFEPDADGNMAVFGTGGSGKSTFLRTVAIAAGFAPARGGPCTVYALDFGSRGLQMLESLPHVGAVISGDDDERIVRVIRQLRATVDERAERYAKVSAGTIEEYRARSGQRDEARILVLIDNFGAFRSAYEIGAQSRWYEMLQAVAADGRSVGVHLVVSADRPAAIPASLGSAIQRRLVLRLANEMDYSMLNVPLDVLEASSPPGRGFMDDSEVQVAVLGGSPNVARQAAEVARLASAMERAGVRPIERVARLADRIALAELPPTVGGLPVLGVWDETLQPIGFEPTGMFLVSGPPQSGKTTTVASMVASLRRTTTAHTFALFAPRRSRLVGAEHWDFVATDQEQMDQLARELSASVLAEEPSVEGLVVVVEGIGDLLNGPADASLQELFKACRTMERFVIVDGETSSVGSSWPLLQAVKSGRSGIAMQPEQMDGDTLFKTSFPRTSRAEYPQGRGLFVRAGRVARVQVALAE